MLIGGLTNGMDGFHIAAALQAYLRALVRASKGHTHYTNTISKNTVILLFIFTCFSSPDNAAVINPDGGIHDS